MFIARKTGSALIWSESLKIENVINLMSKFLIENLKNKKSLFASEDYITLYDKVLIVSIFLYFNMLVFHSVHELNFSSLARVVEKNKKKKKQ